MRKVLFTLVIAGALALGVSSLAIGAQGARCGTLYTPACTAPTIAVTPPSGCKKPSSTFTFPAIHVSSNAGIKKVTVKLGSTTLKSKTFSGRGPTHYTIKGLKISTKGLSTGGHTLTITVKDVRGKTVKHTVRFTVCPPPKFTG